MVRIIIVSPKLLNRMSDKPMTTFIIGSRMIKSHMAPISN
jgi:hypothetical protein